jgi:hypothetical protein
MTEVPNMTRQHQRRQIFVDRPIQGALALRAVMYCALCVLIQLLIVFLFVIFTSSSENVHTNGVSVLWHIQVSLLAWLAILPMILLDIIKLSHRWAGPIFRLRATLQAMTNGESVPPIRFRENDYWQDLAYYVNAVSAELNRLRNNRPEDDGFTESLRATDAHEGCCGSQPARISA